MIYTQILWTYILVIAVTITFSGWGNLTFKAMKIDHSTYGVFESFWLGYAVIVFLTSLVNLFTGINYIVSLCLVLPALLSFPLIKKHQLHDGLSPLGFYFALTCIVLASISFYISQPIFDDEGGYHYPILRLMNELPAIKGIVNIHHRLASPYAGINISAFMSFFPLVPREAVIKLPKILLLSVVLLQLTRSLATHLRREEALLTSYCGISLIVLLLDLKLFFYLGDLDIYLLSFVLFYYFIRLIKSRSDVDYLVIAVLCLLASLSKLSASVFCIATLLLSTIVYCRTKQHLKRVLFTGTLLVLMLIPYVANNVIKSGTLLFPMENTSLDIAWANPETVKKSRLSVTGWARRPGKNFKTSLEDHISWIEPWYKHNEARVKTYRDCVLVSLTLLVFIISFLPRATRREIFGLLALLNIPILGSMIYWFFISPTWRFGGTFLGLVFAVPLALSMYGVSQSSFFHSWTARIREASGVLSGIAASLLVTTAAILGIIFTLHDLTKPLAIHGYSKLPESTIGIHYTPKGKIIYFNSNKAHGNCYDTGQLPCGQYEWAISHAEWLGDKITDGIMTFK